MTFKEFNKAMYEDSRGNSATDYIHFPARRQLLQLAIDSYKIHNGINVQDIHDFESGFEFGCSVQRYLDTVGAENFIRRINSVIGDNPGNTLKYSGLAADADPDEEIEPDEVVNEDSDVIN